MDRRQKFLVSTLISVFLALAAFLLILAISNDFRKSWDVTADQRHSFSQQTNDFVSALQEPIKFYAFVDPNGDSSTVENLLQRYKELSPRFFSFEIVDLQKNPTLADRLQVRNYGQGVLEKVEEKLPEGEAPRRERVLSFDEASITNSLTELLRTSTKTVYFVAGHGERASDQKESQGYSQLATSLFSEGYQAKSLKLAELTEIPTDAAVLILAGPSGDLLAKEQQLLDDYLAKEGKLFFLADIVTPDSYVQWLQKYGFVLGDSVIIDEVSASVGAEPVTPIGTKLAPNHPITKGFNNLTAFTMARPIGTAEAQLADRRADLTVLVETEEKAYLIALKELLKGEAVEFSSSGKTPGSFPLAAAGLYLPDSVPAPSPSPQAESESESPPAVSSRIVVSSSVDAFSNAYLGMAANRDFALNAVNWLSESENQITVRVKDPKLQTFSLTWRTQMWLYFVFCALLPFLSALTGILVAYYRRKGIKP